MLDKNNEYERQTAADLYFDRQQRQQPRDSSVTHHLNEPREVRRTSRCHSVVNLISRNLRLVERIQNRMAKDRRHGKLDRFEVIRQVYPLFDI